MNYKEKLVEIFGPENGEKVAAVTRIRLKIEQHLDGDMDEYFAKTAEHNGYSMENCKVASAVNESEAYKKMLPLFGEDDAEYMCEAIRKVARYKAAGLRRDENYLEAIEAEIDQAMESKETEAGE